MKFVRVSTSGGETYYVAQETRGTQPETVGQQKRADVNRDVRLSLYRKRYSQGESIFTGEPLSEEELGGEGELLDG
jgi:hypothetical protein